MPDATGSQAPPAPSKLKTFLRRLLSTVLLWTVMLTALFSSNRLVSDVVFLVMALFLAVTGLLEFYGLVAKRGLVCFDGCGVFGGALLMLGTFLNLTGLVGTSGSPARVAITPKSNTRGSPALLIA